MIINPTSEFTAVASYSWMIVISEANRDSKSYQSSEEPKDLLQCVSRKKIISEGLHRSGGLP